MFEIDSSDSFAPRNSFPKTEITIPPSPEPVESIKNYNLVYVAGEHGLISGLSPQSVAHGSDGVTVTAVPDAGYHFTSWSDGVTTASRTDLDITDNINVVANFVANSIVTLESISPSSGNNIGSVPLTSITGSGFLSGATVKLTKTGQTDVSCTGFTVNGSTSITGGTCHTANASPGPWNVVVTNTDTGTGNLADGFTVNIYSIGDTGPAGGLIFYVNSNYVADGWRYLEAAPSDQHNNIDWWDDYSAVTGATGTAIGTGLTNTNTVVGSTTPGNTSAVGIAYNYSLNGFADWFLPSIGELNLMRDNLYSHLPNSLGGFEGTGYWSSSEISGTNAYRRSFTAGAEESRLKSSYLNIRAARRFWLNPTYNVTYNGNGNTGGSVPSDLDLYQVNDIVQVASPDDLIKDGYFFTGWNTKEDGSGTSYAENEAFSMGSNNVTLYAQWYRPNYTIAILPDTQSYVNWKPGVMDTQLTWLAGNKSRLNLKFVAHVGDIVQNWETNPLVDHWDTSQNEWPFVQSQMGKLTTAGIPFSTLPGNHDYGYMTRTNTLYNTYFPLSNFSSMSTYGGAYDTNSDNTYHIVQVDADNNGSIDDRLLILSLEFGPRAEVVSWANGVLATHAQTKAIIITHAYLNPSGELLTSGMNHAASNGYGLGGDVYDGDELWASLVEPNDNVRYVFCGHDGISTDGSALRTSYHDGDEAKPVYQIMTNYQYYDVNEAGYLALLNFNSTGVSMKTYSPWLDRYKTDSESQATWDWDF